MEIIILGAVAGFIIYRLYAVLGQDVGIRLAPQPMPPEPAEADTEQAASFHDAKTIGGKVKQYSLLDPTFDQNHFIEGAQAAFGMTLQAFNDGDTDTLKSLLDKKLYNAYAQEIKENNRAGQKRDDQLLRIRSAKLLDLRPKGKNKVEAEIEFVSEQVLLTRDLKGNIIEGDENQIEILTETWTFEREITSDDPNWTITETKSND